MKKLCKFLSYALLTLVVLLVVGISLTIGWRPILGPKARPLTARQFEATPQRLQRGHYIATALSGCTTGCHAPRNLSAAGGFVAPGMEGAGQVMPIPTLPGRVVAPNLTPDPQTGAGNWTDDQLARAIREGIGHDGRTLFPFMPYPNFRSMSDEDLASVIVYLRSLPPVHHELPATEIIFPVKYLMRSAPEPITEAVAAPDRSDPVKYGRYLVTLGSCRECHTPQEKGQAVPGMELAGGFTVAESGLSAATANLTSDASGISYYDEALFIQALRTGYVKARKLSPLMPIDVYKNLSDDDLKAMFAYLRTLTPVKHRVDNSLPPTYCKLCRMKHGGGDQN
ncbi:MAG: cytochrome c [Acidobacteriia bacterium]|nr:cytochrome c [Terriglobia bacterium]